MSSLRILTVVFAILSLAACSRLAAFNALVPQDSGVERLAENVAYGPAARQTLDIYGPQEAAGDAPVVFFIYGGSWNSGAKERYEFVGRAFAAFGYVTVIADYRLVPTVRYPDFVADNAAALAWIYRNISEHGGDADRFFIAGHSAGAYNALMLAMEPRFLAGEGLDRSIIDGVAGLSGPYDFLPLDTQSTRAAFGDVADKEATQPVNLSTRGMPPAFLATGAEDTLVKPRNTHALSEHLQDAGVRVTTKVYPGLDHSDTLLAISRLFRSSDPVLADIDAFFQSL